jgi:DNA-binding transcriptional ArsR family regulator
MDAVFKALADSTRRSLLDELFEQDGQTLSALERRLPMSRFGVMKHLKVLEDAVARSSTSSTRSQSGSSTTAG